MVSWKSSDSTDRLVASLVAAHPSLRIDYHAMALVYGQGATYDAIEGRFRRYRKLADDLRSEAQERGVNVSQVSSTPRTPRGPRSKPNSSSSKGKSTGKSKTGTVDDSGTLPETPSKKPKLDTTSPGLSALTAIALDDSESDVCKEKYEEDVKLKLSTPATPIKSRMARSGSPGGTPTPVLHRIKREDPAAGSVMPIKRSIETSAEEQRKAMGIVQNMGVRMDLEVGSDEDEDIA